MRTILLLIGLVAFVNPTTGFASDEVSALGYQLNTIFLIICAILVMLMASGFAMLEAGMVRNKSVATIILKNISLYSVAGIMFYLVGYRLMYDGVLDYHGTIGIWFPNDTAALSGDYSNMFSSSADWFFQMVFVATAASIVSGALAERVRIEPFLLFVVVLTALIYPITGAWKWGGGWLDAIGFQDFAGSTLVHSVGGWAALTGAIILGPRVGRFDKNGKPVIFLPSAITLVGLGTFLLWFGWFGFNGGSLLSFHTAQNMSDLGQIVANTNMAAAGGVVSAMLVSHFRFGRIDVYQMLNGALAGLVTITAEPLMPTIGQSILFGAAGGALIVLLEPMLLKFKIDDVVGAIPVHLFCGILGTMIVPLTNPDADYVTQLKGILSIGGFVVITSSFTWYVLKVTMGLRLSDADQEKGADSSELGIHAYPYFEEKRTDSRM
jgi:Amt family ammonium transporter